MLSVILIFIDQLIKNYVFINHPNIVLIPGWLGINYAKNTGTLFGMAQGNNSIFIITSLIIILAILFIINKKYKYSFIRKLLQIIFAGGVSNLIDRIYRGFVIDYVSLKFFGVCNLADFCIVAGVILLAIEEIKELLKSNKSKGTQNEDR